MSLPHGSQRAAQRYYLSVMRDLMDLRRGWVSFDRSSLEREVAILVTLRRSAMPSMRSSEGMLPESTSCGEGT